MVLILSLGIFLLMSSFVFFIMTVIDFIKNKNEYWKNLVISAILLLCMIAYNFIYMKIALKYEEINNNTIYYYEVERK